MVGPGGYPPMMDPKPPVHGYPVGPPPGPHVPPTSAPPHPPFMNGGSPLPSNAPPPSQCKIKLSNTLLILYSA